MIPVTENILRGPHPGHDELRDCGIKATLDLESGGQVWGDSLPLLEALMSEALGVRVYPHPLGGILPPTLEELRIGANFLANQEKQGIRTLVHCKHGHERTGIQIAAYRIIFQGWPPFRAAVECFKEGMHYVYSPWIFQLWRLLK